MASFAYQFITMHYLSLRIDKTCDCFIFFLIENIAGRNTEW